MKGLFSIFFLVILFNNCSIKKKVINEIQIRKIVFDTTKYSHKNIKMLIVVDIVNDSDAAKVYIEDSLSLIIFQKGEKLRLKTVESEINYEKYEIIGNNCNLLFFSKKTYLDLSKVDSIKLYDTHNKEILKAKKQNLKNIFISKQIEYGVFQEFMDTNCKYKQYKVLEEYNKENNNFGDM